MEQLVNFVIRPPRADYSLEHDLLDQQFMLKGQWFQRKDLEVINCRGNVLECSHYMPVNIPEGEALPCVIYCHGNSGCRADASEAAIILLPSHITVFALDFSGSGLSEGEHVTLGWNEKDDVKAVVNHLRKEGNVSCIGLWGRSMGAVTSLMYAAEDPAIAGMVLDSPFSNLVDLMMELVDIYKVRLPKFTVKFAIQYMRKVVMKRAKFDIMDLNAIQIAKSCFVPVLIGHATDDDFIHPHHSDYIYDSYAGDKNIIKFEGDHNSPRPQFFFDSVAIFFHNVLNPPLDSSQVNYLQNIHSYFEKGTDVMNKGKHISSVELSQGSMEDTVNYLHSKRCISRTEASNIFSSEGRRAESVGKWMRNNPGSSSDLITFDVSGHLPSNSEMKNDQYLEYTFDSPGDFPCSVEDEENMVMEAVVESLKDLEARYSPEVERAEPSVVLATCPTSNNCGMDTFSITAGSTSNGCESNSTSVACAEPSSDDALMEAPCADGVASPGLPNGGSFIEADGQDGTRATLRAEKSSASHVMEGFFLRWGIFKNG